MDKNRLVINNEELGADQQEGTRVLTIDNPDDVKQVVTILEVQSPIHRQDTMVTASISFTMSEGTYGMRQIAPTAFLKVIVVDNLYAEGLVGVCRLSKAEFTEQGAVEGASTLSKGVIHLEDLSSLQKYLVDYYLNLAYQTFNHSESTLN